MLILHFKIYQSFRKFLLLLYIYTHMAIRGPCSYRWDGYSQARPVAVYSRISDNNNNQASDPMYCPGYFKDAVSIYALPSRDGKVNCKL